MPSVTVIIPCWNAGRFLDALFASLEAQTFRDFETVLVNDGSTESATLERLKSLPSFVRLINQENRGLSGARNTGFRAANTEFVLPLDCDDTIDPKFLQLTVARLRAEPKVDFVYTQMMLTGAREGLSKRVYNAFDQFFLNQLPYCLLMRKSVWEDVGGYDEKMRDGYEDWDFNLRVISSGHEGVCLPMPLFIYRVANDGMLLGKSARLHGALWRRIRDKHPETFRVANLVRLKREAGPGRVSSIAAAALMGASWLLPEKLFNWIFYRLVKRQQKRWVPH